MSNANFFLYSQDILIFASWSKLHKDPLEQYSRIIQRLGAFVQAPRKRTIFGCLITSMTAHSFLNSSSLSCSIISFLISLIATVVYFQRPRWTIPYPPSLSFRSNTNSEKGISLFYLKTRFSSIINANPSD